MKIWEWYKIYIFIAILCLLAPAQSHAWSLFDEKSGDKYGDKEQTIHVLFVGNSYTYTNDLPDMLTKIAASDPTNKITIEVDSATNGGATLLELWDRGDVQKKLRSRHWDFVVLQEQSIWAVVSSHVSETKAALDKWLPAIRAAGSYPIFFITWPRKPNSDWYKGVSGIMLQSAEYMTKLEDYYVDQIIRPLKVPAIPIGDYWMLALSQPSHADLYNSDGSHPSLAGTYLTALIFYRYFSQRPLDHVQYIPKGVSQNDAIFIKHIAAMQKESK